MRVMGVCPCSEIAMSNRRGVQPACSKVVIYWVSSWTLKLSIAIEP